MANDDQRKARELLAAVYDRDEDRAIRAIVAAMAQRAPQNGAMQEGMLDLVEALDAAMVESLMGEGADIWKGNRGKLRNRLPENVGAILAKMRALLAAAPAPEARQPDGYAYRYPVGQPEGVEALLGRMETEARLLISIKGRAPESSDVAALREGAAMIRRLASTQRAGKDGA